MTQPDFWPFALTMASTVGASMIGSSFVQWRRERRQEKREAKGVHALSKEIGETRKSHDALEEIVVGLRGQIKYLEGRLNFKSWKENN